MASSTWTNRGSPVSRRKAMRGLAGLGTFGAGLVLLSGCERIVPLAPAPSRVRRIGYLSPSSSRETTFRQALLDGLCELGWVEGDNVSIGWRYADGRTEPLPGLAGDLVRLQPELLVSSGQAATLALQQQTRTIPIVAIALGGDPVASGLVASLAHPGGNITGMTVGGTADAVKGVEILTEIVPGLTRLAFLFDATNPGATKGIVPAVRELARARGLQVLELDVRSVADLHGAFARATEKLFVNDPGGRDGGG